eukprot:2115737-Prymnesium_polylepis.1
MRVSCASSGGSVAPPMGPETVLEWPSASVVIMVKKPPASPSCCASRAPRGRATARGRCGGGRGGAAAQRSCRSASRRGA